MDCSLDLSPPVVVVNDDEVRAVLACVRRWGWWCLEDDFSHDDSDD